MTVTNNSNHVWVYYMPTLNMFLCKYKSFKIDSNFFLNIFPLIGLYSNSKKNFLFVIEQWKFWETHLLLNENAVLFIEEQNKRSNFLKSIWKAFHISFNKAYFKCYKWKFVYVKEKKMKMVNQIFTMLIRCFCFRLH